MHYFLTYTQWSYTFINMYVIWFISNHSYKAHCTHDSHLSYLPFLILGEILLVSVENKQIIHKFEIIETDILSVFWIREKVTQPNTNSILLMENEKTNDYMKHFVSTTY